MICNRTNCMTTIPSDGDHFIEINFMEIYMYFYFIEIYMYFIFMDNYMFPDLAPSRQ